MKIGPSNEDIPSPCTVTKSNRRNTILGLKLCSLPQI